MASQATRTIEVGVSPEKFFEVITDFTAYPRFLARLGMVGVQVEKDDGDVKLITHAVKKLGKTVSYTLRYTLDKPKKLSWSLVKGQMMSENTGSWVLEEAGEGCTRATYAVEARFGMLVPKSLVKIMISRELPDMLAAFMQEAEGRER
jgi:ribosome-associated toxin RatA of RatAB toxin-antitoxin module